MPKISEGSEPERPYASLGYRSISLGEPVILPDHFLILGGQETPKSENFPAACWHARSPTVLGTLEPSALLTRERSSYEHPPMHQFPWNLHLMRND